MLAIVIHRATASTAAAGEPRPRVEVSHPRPQRPPRRFLWVWVAALVAVTGLALHYRDRLAARLRSAPSAAVRTVEVRSGTLEQTIRLVGSTVAEHSVYLRAPYLRGRRTRGGGTADFRLLLKELAEPGSQVRKGDSVAAFDRMYMLNRLDDYRAARVDHESRVGAMLAGLDVKRAAHRQALRVAKGRMDKAALDLKTAEVHSLIQVALFQVAFEEARMSHNALLNQTKHIEASGMAEVRRAQLDLQEAVVEERRAEANVERMVVRAPIDGLVVVSEIYRGSEFGRIRAGDQLRPGQPYMQIVDPRSMIVQARANQVDVEHLRIGARAHVHFDAHPGLELPARLYSIGPLAKSPGRRGDYVAEVPVLIKLDGTDPRVIPTLSVSAEVIVRREPSTEIIPREAVFYDAEDGQPFAYLQTPSGWEKRDLELGVADNIAVAVRSGLSADEVVAAEMPPNAG